MEKIILNNIDVQKNKLVYDYSYSSGLEEFFNKKYDFFIEYPEEIDLQQVPESILTVPFVTNLMLLCFVENCEIYINDLDKSFYESLPKLKEGFKKIYPDLNPVFNIKSKNITENSYETTGSTMFFTGGVDATSALIENLSEKPTLINIWGGDILLEDDYRYRKHFNYFEKTAESFGLKAVSIKSSVRFMYNEVLLDSIILPLVGAYWWEAISHNLALGAIMAPYMYFYKKGKNFIASTYSENLPLAPGSNYSFINNVVNFGSSKLETTDAYVSREEKISKIIEFSEKTGKYFHLLVCHHPKDGDNCSNCEKCYRTIMAIIQKKADPNLFGFYVNKKTFRNMKKYLTFYKVRVAFWVEMQKQFINEKEYWKRVSEIRWFLKLKINDPDLAKKHRLRIILSKYKYRVIQTLKGRR